MKYELLFDDQGNAVGMRSETDKKVVKNMKDGKPTGGGAVITITAEVADGKGEPKEVDKKTWDEINNPKTKTSYKDYAFKDGKVEKVK